MIYASAAAVVIAVLAWDIGRRWFGSGLTMRLAFNVIDKALSELRSRIEHLEARPTYDWLVERVGELENATSAPVDLTKHDAAVKNLGVQLKELSDHVDAEFKRERAARAGMLAGHQGRRLVG